MFKFLLLLVPILSMSAEEKSPLEKLVEGNLRYVNSTTVCHEDWSIKRTALANGQAPFAVIVACSDSRVPPELIFDQTLGALFIVRVAGNVVDDFAIGSIEYGTTVLGAKLVLVLGHANCGAVDGALKGLKFDNHIQEVLNAIQPAVQATKGQSGNLLEKATKANVRNVEEQLKNSKPVLAKLVQEGKLVVEAAYYHLETGKVEILDQP
jgi:carbonic anhydrase